MSRTTYIAFENGRPVHGRRLFDDAFFRTVVQAVTIAVITELAMRMFFRRS